MVLEEDLIVVAQVSLHNAISSIACNQLQCQSDPSCLWTLWDGSTRAFAPGHVGALMRKRKTTGRSPRHFHYALLYRLVAGPLAGSAWLTVQQICYTQRFIKNEWASKRQTCNSQQESRPRLPLCHFHDNWKHALRQWLSQEAFLVGFPGICFFNNSLCERFNCTSMIFLNVWICLFHIFLILFLLLLCHELYKLKSWWCIP